MAPTVFASPDIAALVAAFPPPIPTKDHPSLLRSLCGGDILSSKTVLTRFLHLLSTGSGRIIIKDLPSLLGIRETKWLFDCLEFEVYYNRDESAILPEPVFQDIDLKLLTEAQGGFVDFESFCTRHDVSSTALWRRIEKNHQFVVFKDSGASNSMTLSSLDYVSSTREKITRVINEAGSEKVHLDQQLPNVSSFVLKQLIDGIHMPAHTHSGRFEYTPGSVVFLPSSYLVAADEERKRAHNSAVATCVRHLEDHGWCLLPIQKTNHTTLHQDIVADFRNNRAGPFEELVNLDLPERQVGIVLKTTLESEMMGIKEAMRAVIESQSTTTKLNLDGSLEDRICKDSSRPELAALLLRSQFRMDLREAVEGLIDEAQKEKFLEFQASFKDILTAPLLLYSAGLAEEPTLRQHQEEYLLSHFKADVVPRLASIAQVLDPDASAKTRPKEVEKLVSQLTQCTSLEDLSNDVRRFEKKHAIQKPSPFDLAATKRKHLLQKLQDLRKMTRPSDVLQNLIWVFLSKAWKEDAIFISAGKDTSRMLRLYQSVGDMNVGRTLEKWRDGIKTGDAESGREMMIEMIRLAEDVVRGMYPDDGKVLVS